MSLFRYSGLATKVRAMSGKLLKDEDFDQISKSSDLIDEEGDSSPPFDEDEY